MYLQLADIHSCLAVDERLWVANSSPSIESIVQLRPAIQPWLAKRSLSATAAGLVFGMVCSSVVFAYTMPRMKLDRQRVIQIFEESFEDLNAKYDRGFPRDVGGWSGEIETVVAAEGGVSPKEGQYMARLAPVGNRKFCPVARIVDLAEYPLNNATETRTVEVTASFHGMDSKWADRNQIRLAAFAEAPQEVKAIWNNDGLLEQALLHLGRTVKMKQGQQGWQTLTATMDIPAGTRSLVIHFGAGTADDAGPKTKHYLDAIHVQFVIKEGSE